ncbi:molecular chaperone DnaK [bacterium]|nr:molecular chaperone DnaK [bacterium]
MAKNPNDTSEDRPKPLVEYEDDIRRFRPEDTEHFRNLILSKIEATKRELGILEESSMNSSEDYSGNNSTYSLHMADQGTDAQEREKAFMLAAREHKFLQHLYQALDRIEHGTYGYCMDTGKPIEFARLEVVPHATLSVEAKKAREEEGR